MTLDLRLRKTLSQHFLQLSRQIEWTSLAVKYQTYIDLLIFTLDEQASISGKSLEQKKLWAVQALMPEDFSGLSFWLQQYDFMMRGEGHLRPEKPLMQLYMETRWNNDESCSEEYIKDVESLWLLTQITQIRGHLAILNAEQILGDDMIIPDIDAKALMEKRKLTQEKLSGAITCPSFDVENTLNLKKCEAGHLGFGLVPLTSTIKLQCKPEYYPTTELISCPTKDNPQESKCLACNCNATGSESLQCDDFTGKCRCKPGFYGDKCETPNCEGKWADWSACSCGANKFQERKWIFTHPDNEKIHCEEQMEEQYCWAGCCWNEYSCGGTVCIPGQQECDYKLVQSFS